MKQRLDKQIIVAFNIFNNKRINKNKFKTESYGLNELMYNGEYLFHICAWNLLSWADEKGYGKISKWANSAKDANITYGELDSRLVVGIASLALGLLGA